MRLAVSTSRAIWLVLLLLPQGTAEAQARWSRAYGRIGFSYASDVEALPTGSVMVGASWLNVNDGDGYAVRLDPTGAVLWARAVGGPGQDAFVEVRRSADGSYLALGETASFGPRKPWLVKIGTDGTVAWQRVWGESFDFPRALVATPDGGAVVVGSRYPTVPDPGDGWVARFDEQGALQWLRTYGGSSRDSLDAVVATAGGTYLVAGSTSSFGATRDAWALELDANGTVLWQRRFDGLQHESVAAAAQTPDGGFVLAGSAATTYDGYSLLKIDADGDVLWHKVTGTSFIPHGFTDVAVLSDGSIVAVGGTTSFQHIQTFAMMKLDANGVVVWTTGLTGARSMAVAPDGFLVAATPTTSSIQTAQVQKVDLTGQGCNPPSSSSLADLSTASAITAATSTSHPPIAGSAAGTSRDRGLDSSLSCPDATFPRVSTPGLYDPATSMFYLHTSNTSGIADLAFLYGTAGTGLIPVAGDWNGDGADTVGLYDPAASIWYLRNSNSSGNADITFPYGPGGRGWIPVVGDWNGDGSDTIGLYDPASSTWYQRNSNDSGFADLTYPFGPGGAGWLPVTGRWFSGSVGLAGLYAPATSAFYLPAQHGDPYAAVAFAYGPGGAGWMPLSGDWNGDGVTTCALFDPAQAVWYLRNSNATGYADTAFAYGPAGLGWIPLTGDWNGR